MGKRRSEIPYSIRLQEKKLREIGREREDAAMTALAIMLVTLADEFGFGLERLTRLGRQTGRQIRDFYAAEDWDVEQEHLRRRLEQIGFRFENGRLLVWLDPENGRPKKQKEENT